MPRFVTRAVLPPLLLFAGACGSDQGWYADVFDSAPDARDDAGGSDADAVGDLVDFSGDLPAEGSDTAPDEAATDAADGTADVDDVYPPSDGTGSVCGGSAGFRCPGEEVCDVHGCWTGATGTCVPAPGACSDLYEPVCGCDGATWGNDCARLSAGVALDHDGECDPVVICKPECRRSGSGARPAWYDSCSGELICEADCMTCASACDAVGTRSEGWYAICTGSGVVGGCPSSIGTPDLIEWFDCAP